jgi:hypothetical protein
MTTSRRTGWVGLLLACFVFSSVGLSPAAACPFCGVVGQSLAERRDAAKGFAVGEAAAAAAPDADGFTAQRFRVAQVIRGDKAMAGAAVQARVGGPVEGTALLFSTGEPPRWTAIPANEALLGYAVAAPATGEPAADRLRWFARRLEHPEPAIATDAFTEFGLAPYAAVRAAADAIDPAQLRGWVEEPGIDQSRRGFYGLALGIAASLAAAPGEAAECRDSLRRAIEAPADDFRAGFDGLLAGVLVADGVRGLDWLEGRGLLGSDARAVDQRHMLAALRFAWESLDAVIPRDRIVAATAKLLSSPVVAADATIDLARYRSWDQVDEVARLWHALGKDDPLIRRAVAGYLSACPKPAARKWLERIRNESPEILEQAIQAAALPTR